MAPRIRQSLYKLAFGDVIFFENVFLQKSSWTTYLKDFLCVWGGRSIFAASKILKKKVFENFEEEGNEFPSSNVIMY